MANRMTANERLEVRRIINEQEEREVAVLTAADPDWLQRVEERKTKVAIGKLGVARQVLEISEINKKIADLEAKRDELDAIIDKKMPQKYRERHARRGCAGRKSLCEAIADIAEAVHTREMSADKTGKLILKANEKAEARRAALEKCNDRNDLTLYKVL